MSDPGGNFWEMLGCATIILALGAAISGVIYVFKYTPAGLQ